MMLVAVPMQATGAQSAAPAEREVTFRNGAVELKGTLMLPTTPGPHPAVVFLHGSGPATRAGARGYAETFARMGIASLFFDKRGSGSSGGSWITASLTDLAADALAAVTYMKSVDGIDPGRIGLWGVSQAGWVATLAASQSKDVAFLVVISGGGASPRASEKFAYANAFSAAGFSAADSVRGFELVEQYFDFLATGKGRTELVARLGGLAGDPLAPLAQQLTQILPSEENRVNWSWVADWDPRPAMARITVPVLLLFGDRDRDHPSQLASAQWRAGLSEAGNQAGTIVMFPGAGHGIRMRDGFTGTGRPPFADGYHDVMLGWLWRNVVHRAP